MKLGIFGGTFNPIHYGHLRAAEEVLEKLRLDRIIFVPSGNPPLKDKELADAKHRHKMVWLATSKNRSFTISDIEYRKKSKSYSVDTLKGLHRLYPDATLYFMLGIDTFIDIPNWWQPDKLIKLTDFIVISRPSFKFTDLSLSPYLKTDNPPFTKGGQGRIKKGGMGGFDKILKMLDAGKIESYKTRLKSGRDIIMLSLTSIGISGSEIRRLTKQGKSIKYLLPEEVESYIIANRLYK